MKKLTPIRAIRLKCLDCSAESPHEVNKCVIPECSLYIYRFGKNPAKKGQGPKTPPFLREHKAQPLNRQKTQPEGSQI